MEAAGLSQDDEQRELGASARPARTSGNPGRRRHQDRHRARALGPRRHARRLSQRGALRAKGRAGRDRVGVELPEPQDCRRQHLAGWLRPHARLRLTTAHAPGNLRQGSGRQSGRRRRHHGDRPRRDHSPGPPSPHRRFPAPRSTNDDRQAGLRERRLFVVGRHSRLDDRQPAADRHGPAVPGLREVLQDHGRLPELRRRTRASLLLGQVSAHEELLDRAERLAAGRGRTRAWRKDAQAVADLSFRGRVRSRQRSTLRARPRAPITAMFEPVLLVAALLSAILMSPTQASAHDPSAYGGLFRSRDGGITWFPANPGRIVSGALALTVNPVEPNHLLLATDSGLLRSRNAGLEWSQEAPSLLVGPVFAVAFDADGRRAIASTATSLARSDDGKTWRDISAPPGALPTRLLVPDGPGRIYLVGWQRLYASADWGTSWSAVASPLPEAPITQMVVAHATASVYAIAGGRLWSANDGTSAWRPADADLPQGRVDALSADPREVRRLWATAGDQMFRSDDGAASWRPWGRPVLDAPTVVRGIALSLSGRDAVVTTDRGLYRSAGGDRWEIPSDNLPAHLEAWPLVRDPTDPATLYAGFALIPYPELWRLAAEQTSALARVGPMGWAGSVAFLVLVALAGVAALRALRRYDRHHRRARAA